MPLLSAFIVTTLGGCLISFDDYPAGDICDAGVAEAQALDDPALRRCAEKRKKPVDAATDSKDAEVGADGP